MRTPLALVLIFVAAVLCLRPMLAANPFDVTENVKGAGASTLEAYNNAIDSGRRKAWVELVHRLTPQSEWAALTAIDDSTLQSMVENYRLRNEARSTTRYVATVTYVFNQPLVRRYFRNNNISYSLASAAPMLVVPMSPSYDPNSLWSNAWSSIHVAGGVVPLVLPKADMLNTAALSPLGFRSAGWSDIAPAAARAGASEAALVQAGPASPGHLAVGIRVLYANQPAQALTPLDIPVPANLPPAAAYGLAAKAAAKAIGAAWTATTAVDFGKPSTLTVNLLVPSLSAWGALQNRLQKLPVVEAVRIRAVEIGQLQADIDYAGTQTQLSAFLAQAGYTLDNRNGDWWLDPASGPSSTGSR